MDLCMPTESHAFGALLALRKKGMSTTARLWCQQGLESVKSTEGNVRGLNMRVNP